MSSFSGSLSLLRFTDCNLNFDIFTKFMILIGQNSATHMHGLMVYEKDGLPLQRAFLFIIIFFNWDSPHQRLNSHYKAWSYKKKKHKKITSYRKSV